MTRIKGWVDPTDVATHGLNDPSVYVEEIPASAIRCEAVVFPNALGQVRVLIGNIDTGFPSALIGKTVEVIIYEKEN